MRTLMQPTDCMGSSWPAVSKPIITSPANGATGLSVIVSLQLTAVSAPMDGDTQASTTWEIRTAPGGGGTLRWSSAADPVNLLGITVPALSLALGQEYYVRVRFNGVACGPGPWSDDVHIST